MLTRRYGSKNFEGYEALHVPAPSSKPDYIATEIRNGICGEEVNYDTRTIRVLVAKPPAETSHVEGWV